MFAWFVSTDWLRSISSFFSPWSKMSLYWQGYLKLWFPWFGDIDTQAWIFLPYVSMIRKQIFLNTGACSSKYILKLVVEFDFVTFLGGECQRLSPRQCEIINNWVVRSSVMGIIWNHLPEFIRVNQSRLKNGARQFHPPCSVSFTLTPANRSLWVSLVDFVEKIKGVPKWALLGCNVKSDKPPKQRITKLFHLNCSGHFSKGKTYPSSSKVYGGGD